MIPTASHLTPVANLHYRSGLHTTERSKLGTAPETVGLVGNLKFCHLEDLRRDRPSSHRIISTTCFDISVISIPVRSFRSFSVLLIPICPTRWRTGGVQEPASDPRNQHRDAPPRNLHSSSESDRQILQQFQGLVISSVPFDPPQSLNLRAGCVQDCLYLRPASGQLRERATQQQIKTGLPLKPQQFHFL